MTNLESQSRTENERAVELPESPYPGLRAFLREEWPIFFGRERMVDQVIDRIGGSQFMVIHGASGSGKSSLIRAGVIAQLQQEHASRRLAWCPATMMPGSSPMWHFADALISALGRSGRDAARETAKTRLRLNRRAKGVAETLQEFGFGDDQRLFILIDQFEELFRFADEGGVREAADFVRLLVDLYHRRLDNVYITLTMRSDHLGDCSRFEGLAEIVNTAQYLVPPMNERELQDAIRLPAKYYQGTVSKELADRLVRDTRHSADQLPLIQHVLSYLWNMDQGDAPELTLETFQETAFGSVTGALSKHATSVMKELSGNSTNARSTTERLFRALTQIDDTGRAIRRRRSRDQLLEGGWRRSRRLGCCHQGLCSSGPVFSRGRENRPST